MDIWVSPTNENALKLVKAIDEYGFDASPLLEIDFTQTLVFDVGRPPAQIVIMNYISALTLGQLIIKNKKVSWKEFHLI